jgi:hypothetical protein
MEDIIAFNDGSVRNQKEVEQIKDEVIKIFAQHKLSYNEAIYCLEEVKKKLLSKCIIKD